MKRAKGSRTLTFTVSCTSWLGRFIAEHVPFHRVMLSLTEDAYILYEDEYFSFAESCHLELMESPHVL